MGWFRFLRRSHWDRERAAELESYLQIETDDNIARGMSPEQARRAARLKLGNTVRIREDIHYMNTIGALDSLGRDLRYALRGMRRNPTFTLAVVLTLALGLGATTAIFAVVDGVLIKPLAYPDAEQLVSLNHTAPGIKVDEFQLSPTQYFTYKEQNRVFQHIGVWTAGGTTITGIGDPEQARMLAITPDVLQVLGVQPMLGCNFTEAEATTTDRGIQVGAGAAIFFRPRQHALRRERAHGVAGGSRNAGASSRDEVPPGIRAPAVGSLAGRQAIPRDVSVEALTCRARCAAARPRSPP
jgi:MacB-like protein